MLAERILQALEVLGDDESVAYRTLRDQASSYIGEKVDDRCLRFLATTAHVVYEQTIKQAIGAGYDPEQADKAAKTNVIVAGLAVGKRLGIEDGEAFARSVPDVN